MFCKLIRKIFLRIILKKNYCIRLLYDMKNCEDRGGCYPPRPLTSSSIFATLRITRKPNAIIDKYLRPPQSA